MSERSRKRLRPARAPSAEQRLDRADARADDVEGGARARARQGTVEGDLALVRDVARPLVERALLALYVVPHDPDRLARFVDILERSRLPAGHRAALVDRLRSDQAAADVIAASIRAAFGADGPELRDALIRSLEALQSALAAEPGERSWALSDGREVALPPEALDGSLSVRAEALVGALAEAVHAPEAAAGEATGAAFARICRDLPLLLPWEEDEEELVPPPPEGG